MKKNSLRKLKVQSETLRSLAQEDAKRIQGGIDVGTFGCFGDIQPALSGGWPCCLANR